MPVVVGDPQPGTFVAALRPTLEIARHGFTLEGAGYSALVATEPTFAYSDLLPIGPDETPYRLVTTEGVSTFEADGQTFLRVAPEAIRQLTSEAMHDIAHYLRPAHLAQLRRIIDDPEASGNDRFVATRPAQERQHLRRRRAADVPGHRHRDRDGQEVRGRAHGRRRRRGDQPRRVRRVHEAQPALLPARAAHDVGGEEHRHQPAGADRDLLDAVLVAGSPSTSSCSWPRAAGRRTSRSCSRRPRRCSTPSGCWSSSTRRSARSARPRARRTTWRW